MNETNLRNISNNLCKGYRKNFNILDDLIIYDIFQFYCQETEIFIRK
jgi:hypothetical protein